MTDSKLENSEEEKNQRNLDTILAELERVEAELNSAESQTLNLMARQSGIAQLIHNANNVNAKRNEAKNLRSELNALYMGVYKNFIVNRDNLQKISQVANAEANGAVEMAGRAKKIAENALQTATEASGISAGKPLIEHFSKRDDDLDGPCRMWMSFTIAFFLISLLFLIFVEYVLGKPDASSVPSIILYVSSKVIILTLLVGAMVWCARLFRDAYDKKSFYKHKVVITRTYQAFTESAHSPEIKDAVLKESVKHIFSSPPPIQDAPKAEIEIFRDIPGALEHLGKIANQK